MSPGHLDRLFQAVGSADSILILPHNNPDPDAIASAVALRYLLAEKLKVEGDIVYQGLIGRAENKALVHYLGHPLRLLTDLDRDWLMPVALIDTQPGAGNNPLVSEAAIVVVIGRHTWTGSPPITVAGFADVRADVGATSTILTEYLQTADIEPPTSLATALFYGIKTNTFGLGRNASSTDVAAYYYLQPRIDVVALAEIEQARVPTHYFKSFDLALRAAQVYDGVVISYMGSMSYPDLAAEMADLLLRLEEAKWVICAGVYQDTLILSIRTRKQPHQAEQLVQAIVGTEGTAGGHGTMAGGQISLAGKDPELIVSQLVSRTLQNLKIAPGTTGKPLF